MRNSLATHMIRYMGGYRYILSLLHRSDTDIVLLLATHLCDTCCTPHHRETAVLVVMVVDSEAPVTLVLVATDTLQHICKDRAPLARVPVQVAERAPGCICRE